MNCRPARAATLALLLLPILPLAHAAPVLRLDAGISAFELEHEGRDARSIGGATVLDQEDSYDSGAALRLGAEAGWAAGERLEWLLRAALTHAGDADKTVWQRTTAGTTQRRFALESLALLNLRGGLRWQHGSGPVRVHADVMLGGTHWRYEYGDPSAGQEDSDGDFATADATVGFLFTLAPGLDFVVDYGEQFSRSNHNRQAVAGLRFTPD